VRYITLATIVSILVHIKRLVLRYILSYFSVTASLNIALFVASLQHPFYAALTEPDQTDDYKVVDDEADKTPHLYRYDYLYR